MNPIVWTEIPVADMPRAMKFYSYVFGWEMKSQMFGPIEMAWLPSDPNNSGASGSLVKHEMYTPSEHGSLLYLATEDIPSTLKNVEPAGGKVLLEKTLISEEVGYMALFLDSEGNRMALYSK